MKAKFVKSVLFLAVLSMTGTLIAAEPKPVVPEQTWTVSFKDVDIVEVVKFVQEVTGKPIIVDPKVRGPIRVMASKPMNKKELYDLFLAALDVHGFTAFESDGVVRVVVNREARNLPIPNEQAVTSRNDGYITQIIQLNNISAAKVLAAIRPLVPQYAHLTAYEPSNALIISDTRANIARINDLILQMDKAAVLATDVMQLRYAQAAEVVAMITQLEKPDPNRGVTTSPPIVVADKRINAVVISGDEMSRQRIKGLVESLDRPQTRNSNVRVFYLKYAKAADVAKVLTGMSQGQGGAAKPGESGNSQTNVQADEATNSLLVTADSDNMQSLVSVIEQLDIRRAQVLVEAIIVEIQNNANKDMGIQWMYADTKKGFGTSNDGSATLAGLGEGALNIRSSDPKVYDTGVAQLAKGLSTVNGQAFGTAFLGERTTFIGLLKLLQEDSGTNILSTPNLLTTDNTKAKISVGQKVPFKQGSYTQTGTGTGTGSIGSPYTTFQREDVGITLEVTPHINEGNSVVLDIDQEVSSISNISSADGIITNQRKIKTQILTADGQTVVLGGLIKDDIQTGATRVPLLGSIPVMGHLFRTQTSKKVKTNLLVFIRATVLRDDEMLVGATAEKYSAIRDVQLQNRRSQKELVDSKSIPVLPDLHDKPLPPPEPKAKVTEPATPIEATPAPVQAPVKSE
ncbi:type II secretion system protein D [Cellvibrio zantedeschiae]|uniref:Type II secretion system protein D n=1 Tax=Cellvibrio zantedeschiae TaxID=1237077 RepID=A0ABQ3BD24_9GAMM|nr:type II secretion system secretin GspD [Cellvibrio zantedeschiae]GGY86811.1 type II secretion system protein D [Cellvibrio zantedeschiae]